MQQSHFELCFRVRPVVDLYQFFHRDVCVDLRGGEARVAEQLLYVAQVCAAVEEVRGEGVAQGVRAYVVVYARADFDVLVHHAPDRARRDSRALVVQEDGQRVALGEGRVVEERGAHFGQVSHQRVQRGLAEGHYALLAPLALDANHPPAEVNVLHVQLHQLRDAHARAVEHLQNGAVALPQVRRNVGRLYEAHGVLHGQVGRELLLEPRRRDELRGVRLDDSLAHEELEERPERGEFPRNGALLLLLRVQLRHPLANRYVIYVARVQHAALARARVCGR